MRSLSLRAWVMKATTKGWEMVWPQAIGSDWSDHASSRKGCWKVEPDSVSVADARGAAVVDVELEPLFLLLPQDGKGFIYFQF